MVFHYINENVKPLRAALAQANAELRAAMDKLHSLRSRLAVRLRLYPSIISFVSRASLPENETLFRLHAQELQKMLDILSEKMSVALAAKQKCQDEAEATAFTIDLANRLVNGLASENVRWAETVQMYVNFRLARSIVIITQNVISRRTRDL